MYSTMIVLSDLNEISLQIFEKFSYIKFFENHPVGAELFHADRQTGGHDEDNSRFSQFSEGAQ